MSYELLREGGPVLWVILLSGILAMGVFVERALHLHRARIKSEDFLTGIVNILRRGNIEEALTICEDTPGPVSYIVKTAILHRSDAKDTVRSAVADASQAETSRMERRLVVVATVAQIAPLLGLLGTILAMVESLIVLRANTPLIQSTDVVGGLMPALLTSAAGLMVAIPCYAAFNLLVLKIDRIVLDMERAGSEIVAFVGETFGKGQE
jgi:biopolymer transport protein ExbB